MSGNPFISNCDVEAIADEATGISMGDANGGVIFVIALTNPKGRDIAAFLNREMALEVFGRFSEQLREMGWLQ